MERSLVILKPDAIERGLAKEIMQRLENVAELAWVALKQVILTPEQVRAHYSHLLQEPYYKDLEAFMTSKPVALLIAEGREGVVKRLRHAIGPTDSAKAPPGTIRGDYGDKTVVRRNVVHGSDSVDAAQREIAIFFPELTEHTDESTS